MSATESGTIAGGASEKISRPPLTASFIALLAVSQSPALGVLLRASNAAHLMLSKMSCPPFDAAPSVPTATLAPAANMAGTGAIPVPSTILLIGLCTASAGLRNQVDLFIVDPH